MTRSAASGRYPKGAVDTAISALELSYSYLRDKPVIEEVISDALHRLYRYREIETGESKPVRQVDPDHNPDYVMGPGDDVPRLGTVEELRQLGVKP